MSVKKRRKDYPANVPRKLFQLLKQYDWNRSLLATYLGVNGGYISNLLNKGIEPTDTTIHGRSVRKKLFLKAYKLPRRKINRTIQNKPDWLTKWNHLTKEERDKVKQQYIKYKEQK